MACPQVLPLDTDTTNSGAVIRPTGGSWLGQPCVWVRLKQPWFMPAVPGQQLAANSFTLRIIQVVTMEYMAILLRVNQHLTGCPEERATLRTGCLLPYLCALSTPDTFLSTLAGLATEIALSVAPAQRETISESMHEAFLHLAYGSIYHLSLCSQEK